MRKAERLKENAGASDVILTAGEVKAIDEKLERMPRSQVFGGSRAAK